VRGDGFGLIDVGIIRKSALWRLCRYRHKRHTTGLTVYRATKDLRLVQRLLGHSKVSTTAIYADVLDEDVAAAQNAAWAVKQ